MGFGKIKKTIQKKNKTKGVKSTIFWNESQVTCVMKNP